MDSSSIHAAKTGFSKLLAKVRRGESILILNRTEPVAKLVPVGPKDRRTRPKVGTITSGPVSYDGDAFVAMSKKALEDWGL